jgi:hypothetical protein
MWLDDCANFLSTLMPPERAKTGGSRERLSAMQLYEPIVNVFGGHT